MVSPNSMHCITAPEMDKAVDYINKLKAAEAAALGG